MYRIASGNAIEMVDKPDNSDISTYHVPLMTVMTELLPLPSGPPVRRSARAYSCWRRRLVSALFAARKYKLRRLKTYEQTSHIDKYFGHDRCVSSGDRSGLHFISCRWINKLDHRLPTQCTDWLAEHDTYQQLCDSRRPPYIQWRASGRRQVSLS